jgi:hypothetical protein
LAAQRAFGGRARFGSKNVFTQVALEKGELVEVHTIFEVDDWICNALHFGPNGFPLALRRENGDRSSQNSIAI